MFTVDFAMSCHHVLEKRNHDDDDDDDDGDSDSPDRFGNPGVMTVFQMIGVTTFLQ